MFANHLIGDGKFGLSFVRTADSEHTEIVEQAHEIVRIGDIDSREAFLQFSGNVALVHQCLDNGSVVGKFLVLADKHTQLFIVNADIILHHIPGRFAVIVKIVPDKIEHHVRVVHRGSAITFLCKAVVVIPWLHHFDQFVHTMTERAGGRIIGQHSAHFFFRKAYHFIKLGRERIVGADIEAAGEVVHRHRADSGNETTLDAGIGSGFYFIEEGTQIPFAMRFVSISS